MSLALQSNAVTVLLGRDPGGQDELMRIMAGLDVPTQGRVLVDGKDANGHPCARPAPIGDGVTSSS